MVFDHVFVDFWVRSGSTGESSPEENTRSLHVTGIDGMPMALIELLLLYSPRAERQIKNNNNNPLGPGGVRRQSDLGTQMNATGRHYSN